MSDTLDGAQRRLLGAAAPLVQERSTVLSDAARMLRFLFVDDAAFAPDDDAAAQATSVPTPSTSSTPP